MRNHKLPQRALAMALSVIMILGLVPITASADTFPVDTGAIITAFDSLAEETVNQTVPTGTSLEELNLPDTLQATVSIQTDNQGTTGESVETRSIPVSWNTVSEFNGNLEGTYVFSPILPEQYTLSLGVNLPQISVNVQMDTPSTTMSATGNTYTVSISSTTGTNIQWHDLKTKLSDGTIKNGDTIKILDTTSSVLDSIINIPASINELTFESDDPDVPRPIDIGATAENMKLTLKDIYISGSSSMTLASAKKTELIIEGSVRIENDGIAIFANDDFIISGSGDLLVRNIGGISANCAFYSMKDLTIKSTGTLGFYVGNSQVTEGFNAINCYRFTQLSGLLMVYGGNSDNGHGGFGIFCTYFTVSGDSNLMVHGGNGSTEGGNGIHAALEFTQDSGTINVFGGSSTGSGVGGNGILCGRYLTINGKSNLTVMGGDSAQGIAGIGINTQYFTFNGSGTILVYGGNTGNPAVSSRVAITVGAWVFMTGTGKVRFRDGGGSTPSPSNTVVFTKPAENIWQVDTEQDLSSIDMAVNDITLRSNAVTLTTVELATVNKPVISIISQPEDITVTEGAITEGISVWASVSENITRNYQWFRSTSYNDNNGTAVTGANSSVFYIPNNLTAGNYYYYCEISAQGADNLKTNVVKVTVNPQDDTETPPAYEAVTNITLATRTVTTGTNINLTGTVVPASATNKTIVWSIKNAGTTGAALSGNILSATAEGTVIVTATIAGGASASAPYMQDFTITVNAVTGGGSGGSGGGTQGGSNSGTPVKEQITVDVKQGNTDSIASQISIERTTNENGTKSDQVTYQKDKAVETVQKLKDEGKDTARIVIPDDKDEVSETKVNIPAASLGTLADGKINLQIDTEEAKISLPKESIKNTSQLLTDDLYFRLVPIKNETERETVSGRARLNAVQVSGNSNVTASILGNPVTIETNMPSAETDITLPLTGVVIPAGRAEKEAFLKQLAVYIEHSDGEKELVQGVLAEYKEGTYGIRFHINKFSTFTVVKTDAFTNSSVKEISGVTSPEDAVIKGNTITASVASERSSFTVEVAVRGNASWKLYLDKELKKEAGDKTLTLTTGANTSYIKVTAQDGTSKVYKLTITREKSSKAEVIKVIIPEKAVIKGNTITATVTNENSVIMVKTQVSSKASMKLYSDKTLKKEIKNRKVSLKEGNNTVYLKVTAENGTSKVYTLEITRKAEVYKNHINLGLIGSKDYAYKVAKIFEQDYDSANVKVTSKGRYYLVTMDFKDRAAAKSACEDMKRREYIINYYFN